MLALRQAVASNLDAVNQLIIDELRSDVALIEQIGHHLINAGGKRLRPLVVLQVAEACGYKGDDHIRLAVIIEFIHTATLLHDDVVDTSQLRRGKPTANDQWGNAPSVLVGDFLYSRAFQLLVGLGEMDIMKIMANTTNIISEGEVEQLINRGNSQLSEEAYLKVVHRKTAQLFEGASQAAATLSTNDPAIQESMRLFGYHLGMAFQLVDDALDYSGEQHALGKNIGDDLSEGKVTLPLIYAMQHGSPSEARRIREAIDNGGTTAIREIGEIVARCGGLEYTAALARRYSEKGLAAVNNIPASPATESLREMASFAVQRQY